MGGACGTYVVEEKCLQSFVGKAEEKTPLGTRGLRSKDITIMVDRHMMSCGRDSSGPLQQAAGSCEYVNGPSGSITCGELLEQLRNCLLLKTDYAPWSLEFVSQITILRTYK